MVGTKPADFDEAHGLLEQPEYFSTPLGGRCSSTSADDLRSGRWTALDASDLEWIELWAAHE